MPAGDEEELATTLELSDFRSQGQYEQFKKKCDELIVDWKDLVVVIVSKFTL